jgi:hypothetical protein
VVLRGARSLPVSVVAAMVLFSLMGCGSEGHRGAAHVRSLTIGSGRTLSGVAFVVSLAHLVVPPGESAVAEGCPIAVTVSERGRASYSGVCFSRMSSPVRPSVDCVDGSWLIHVETQTLARFATLTLSDGRTVMSPVLRVPPALGGPASLYFQAVPASGPRPTRLVEEDQSGRVIGESPITPRDGCGERPGEVIGGARPLVRVLAPDHRDLLIAEQRYAFLGRPTSTLSLSYAGRGGRLISHGALRVSPTLEWEVQRICAKPAYYVVYGVASATRERLGVRAGAEVVMLDERVIPKGRRVVYGIVRSTPEEFVTRRGDSRTKALIDIASAIGEIPCASD